MGGGAPQVDALDGGGCPRFAAFEDMEVVEFGGDMRCGGGMIIAVDE